MRIVLRVRVDYFLRCIVGVAFADSFTVKRIMERSSNVRVTSAINATDQHDYSATSDVIGSWEKLRMRLQVQDCMFAEFGRIAT